MPSNELSAEEIRILAFVAQGRVITNEAGRWIILPDPDLPGAVAPRRPERKARERLFKLRLIDYTWDGIPRGHIGYAVTDKGREAINAAIAAEAVAP